MVLSGSQAGVKAVLEMESVVLGGFGCLSTHGLLLESTFHI